MRHQKKGKILSRPVASRQMMLRNLASSLIIYEKVKTTLAKAKTVQPLVDKIIGLAKKNDLTAKRRLLQILPQKMAYKKAIEILSSRYQTRKSGYSRIIKLERRLGDGAKIAQIELV